MAMASWDVRILTASYTNEDGEVVVELFGKTRDGKSAVVRCHGFKPYFYLATESAEEVRSALEGDKDVLAVEEGKLFLKGKDRDVVKITLRFPWTVPQYRKRLGHLGLPLAADIPFHERFIYDNGLGSCVKVEGQPVEPKGRKYTTELVIEASALSDCEDFRPSLKILSFDIENSIKTDQIFTICLAVRDGDELLYETIRGEEKDILLGFQEAVQRHDPDVLTGYNIDGYDIPKIMDRAKLHRLGDLSLGRDYGPVTRVMNRFWRVHGRIIADAWWNAKRELRPKQETLNAVAKLVLGEEKLDVDPIKIDQEWAEDPDKVCRYCVKDAELALRILENIAVLEKNMDMATVSKLPLAEVMSSGASTLIDSILIREADRNGIAVPMTHHRSGRKIEGAYVHTLEPGVYHWVCVLDFKAMYPSLIIQNNICFTTLADGGEHEAPNGVRYLSKDKREGLIPRILVTLMRERDETKRKMKGADEKAREYYDGLQNALKILMNSFYGVMASSFYRFTNQDIGESITAFAREATKGVIRQLEGEGVKVIYSDTDSIFFQSPETNLDGCVDFGKKVAKRFSKGGLTLEFEKVLEPLFTHGKKKRYVGRVLWPEVTTIVRGYETRRTDAFDLQSEALEAVFERILEDDTDGAVRTAREYVDMVRSEDVALDKLVISRSVKDFRTYKDPDSQSNVQTAKKLIKMCYDFVEGMKVSWIVVNGRKVPQEVEPWVSGREFGHVPDHEYYARRLASTLSRATEVFGWDEKALLTGGQQSTLFGFGGGGGPSKKKRGPKVEDDRKMTLEDFM